MDFRKVGQSILNEIGYIPPEKRSYPLQTEDGKYFGEVGYKAIKAINEGRLDQYQPSNDNERSVLDAFKQHLTQRESFRNETRRREYAKTNQNNPIAKRYNINQNTFSLNDFSKWAESHNFKQIASVDSAGLGAEAWTPKKQGGFLGFGGTKLTSSEDEEALPVLFALAQNNARKEMSSKDAGAMTAAVTAAGNALTMGTVQATAERNAKSAYRKAGLPEEKYQTGKEIVKNTEARHPLSSKVGSIAGSVGSLYLIGGAVGEITQGIKWFSSIPQWAQSAINSGITFATTSGTNTASESGSPKEIIRNAGIGLLGGAAGGSLSNVVGGIGEKILFDKGLQHKIIPEMIRNGAASTAFAAGSTGTSYLLYPKDSKPTAEDVTRDLVSAFAFGAIGSAVNSMKTSTANKKYLDELYQKMGADYEKMARMNVTNKNDVAGMRKLADNVLEYSKQIESYLTGKGYKGVIDGKEYTFTPNKVRLVGQDKYVNTILGEIETIKNSANAVKSGVGGGTSDIAKAPVEAVNGPDSQPGTVTPLSANFTITTAKKAQNIPGTAEEVPFDQPTATVANQQSINHQNDSMNINLTSKASAIVNNLKSITQEIGKGEEAVSEAVAETSKATAVVAQKIASITRTPVNTDELYLDKLRIAAKPTEIMDSDSIATHAAVFADAVKAKNSIAMQALGDYAEGLGEALEIYALTGEMPEMPQKAQRAFAQTGRVFKDVLKESASGNYALNQKLYGQSAEVDIQLKRIENGDFEAFDRMVTEPTVSNNATEEKQRTAKEDKIQYQDYGAVISGPPSETQLQKLTQYIKQSDNGVVLELTGAGDDITSRTVAYEPGIPIADILEDVVAYYADGRSPIHTGDDMQFSLNSKFEDQYDKWAKSNTNYNTRLTVGRTSEALKSIGLSDKSITWDTAKIAKIKNKHNMSDQIIKQVPLILENPVIVMRSQQKNSRLTMLGEVYDLNEKPVLAILELEPVNVKGDILLDEIKLVSAYGKDNLQSFINKSEILYIDPDTKRTDEWLTHNRLQLPLGQTTHRYDTTISQDTSVVNDSVRENKGNDTKPHTVRNRTIEGGIGDGKERTGNVYPNGNMEREAGTNTNEPIRQVAGGTEEPGRTGEPEERTARTRRLYTKDAESNGQIVQKTFQAGNRAVRINAIDETAYNTEMKGISAQNAKDGLETVFFSGSAKIAFGGGKSARGVLVNEKIMLIQYDHPKYTPQQIQKHELAHKRYQSREVQKIKNVIANSFSLTEQRQIMRELYRDYYNLTDGNEAKVFEEFVCDIMAGMNEYGAQFDDLTTGYWNGEKAEAGSYDPATYTESTDAGGQDKYSISYQNDGKPALVVIEDDIFKGHKGEKPYKVIRDYLRQHIGEYATIIESGQKVYFGKDLPGEYTQSKYTQRLDKERRLAKSQATQSLNEMIEIGADRRWRKNFKEKHNIDAKYGFYKYSTRFKIGKSIYAADVLIRNAADGKKYLYDIQNIKKETVSQYGDLTPYAPTAKSGAVSETNGFNTNTISQNKASVNDSIRESNGDDTTEREIKGAEQNDDLKLSLEDDVLHELNELAKKYGAIQTGERPAREVKVPKKNSKMQYVSRFARTMLEAGATPDHVVSEFESKIIDGSMAHEVITDKQAKAAALRVIKDKGFGEAMAYWNHVIESERGPGKNDMALGMTLYNQCVNAKDVSNAMRIAVDLAAEATRAGQVIQSCRLLKQMAPDGQLYSLEKSLQKMNEEFKKKLGGRFEGIKLNEKLAKDLLEADTEQGRAKALDALQEDIAKQIPSRLIDKWNSWRYLAMLGNPRTHIRNIVGNAVFVPAIEMKNAIGTILEKTISKEKRTKAIRKTRDSMNFAKKDFGKVEAAVRGESGRYEIMTGVEEKRRIFKNPILETYRKKNFDFLEKEDVIFLKRAYINSFAGAMTARGYTSEFLNSGTQKANTALEELRNYATLEAQRATYRDANAVAHAMNKFQNHAKNSDSKALKAAGLLMEGVVPFKKTPLNILRRGVEYSPLGVLSGTYKLVKGVESGKWSAAGALDDLAKGITGSMLVLLGMWLAHMGLIKGEEDEEAKMAKFESMQGIQSYSIVIGGHSYTIDWMAPASLPFFVGVEAMKMLDQGGVQFSDLVDAMTTIAEPMTELSLLQGLDSVIKTAAYSQESALTAVVSQMVLSYFGQAVPTLSGQFARTIDQTRRSIYVDKNSKLPAALDRFIQQTEAKIPFASFLLQPRVDNWGRVETYGDNPAVRAVSNFLSPGYYKEINTSSVDKALEELYQKTGESKVLPRSAPKYFTQDGVRINLTGTQYTDYAQMRGRKAYELVNKIVSSPGYKSKSDAEKVKAINKAYDKANDYAKKQIVKKYRLGK